MIIKLTNVIWPEGTLVEAVKLWQQDWFYAADQSSENQGEVPVFSTGPPRRLFSWTNKDLDWGNQKEVKALQGKLKAVVGMGVQLLYVVHVILHCRILPIQIPAAPMWEYKSEDGAVIQSFSEEWTSMGCGGFCSSPRRTPFPPGPKTLI